MAAKRISLSMARAAEAAKAPAVKAPTDDSPEEFGAMIGRLQDNNDQLVATERAMKAASDLKNTTISLPSETLRLLTRVAAARQETEGGRRSVSSVIDWLARRNWSELEEEVKAHAKSLSAAILAAVMLTIGGPVAAQQTKPVETQAACQQRFANATRAVIQAASGQHVVKVSNREGGRLDYSLTSPSGVAVAMSVQGGLYTLSGIGPDGVQRKFQWERDVTKLGKMSLFEVRSDAADIKTETKVLGKIEMDVSFVGQDILTVDGCSMPVDIYDIAQRQYGRLERIRKYYEPLSGLTVKNVIEWGDNRVENEMIEVR